MQIILYIPSIVALVECIYEPFPHQAWPLPRAPTLTTLYIMKLYSSFPHVFSSVTEPSIIPNIIVYYLSDVHRFMLMSLAVGHLHETEEPGLEFYYITY